MRVNWKGASLFLLFALAFSCLTLGYVYTIGQQHVPTQIVEGDVSEHITTFEVMIGPGVDRQAVYRALMLCPNAYGFTIIPYDEERVMPFPCDGYDNAPFPNDNEDWLIVFIDGDQYDANAAGWTVTDNRGRITVQAEETWPDMILAHVITHECTHQFETGRLDYPEENSGALGIWEDEQWLGEYEEGRLYSLYLLDVYLNS